MPRGSEFIPVGRIAGVFGTHGELKCDPTSAGRSLFVAGSSLRARLSGGDEREVAIAAVREHKNRLLLRFDGVDDATQAHYFAGTTLLADRARIVLGANEYLDRDLVGCALVDPNGTSLGTVLRVEHYPHADMLVVEGGLVPMIREFIRSVDLDAKRIVAELPPGLLDPPR